MAMNYVNLTPHDINMRRHKNGREFTCPASGEVARVETVEEQVSRTRFFLPCYTRRFGKVEGLPEPKEGTVYIVSSLVLENVRGRTDVVAPDTGPTAVRNEKGHIVAVTRWVVLPEEDKAYEKQSIRRQGQTDLSFLGCLLSIEKFGGSDLYHLYETNRKEFILVSYHPRGTEMHTGYTVYPSLKAIEDGYRDGEEIPTSIKNLLEGAGHSVETPLEEEA